jgi:hypothetical protein
LIFAESNRKCLCARLSAVAIDSYFNEYTIGCTHIDIICTSPTIDALSKKPHAGSQNHGPHGCYNQQLRS